MRIMSESAPPVEDDIMVVCMKGRRRGQVRVPRRLSKRRSLAWKLTPGAGGRSALRATAELCGALRQAGGMETTGEFVRIFGLQNRIRMLLVQMANCSFSSPLRRGPMECSARTACSMSECVCLTVNTKLSPARCGTV